MGESCCDGVCSKCWSLKYIIVGVVLFAATWYAKSKSDVYLIWYALAALVVLKGILKLAMPGGCGHCNTVMPAKKAKK